jgi:cobalt/nickel transport system permease protein
LSLVVRQLLYRTAVRYQQLSLGVISRGLQQEFRFWQPRTDRFSWRYAVESIGGAIVLAIVEILLRIYVWGNYLEN